MRVRGDSATRRAAGENRLGLPREEAISFSCGDLAVRKTVLKRPGGGPWIYKLEEDFTFETDYLGIEFESTWLRIQADGTFPVRAGYAWDGNSKMFNVLDLFIVGTPDGIVDIRTMKPKTWYASLAHDALYQYYGYHGLSLAEMDRVYLQFAREAGFALAGVYYACVRALGWLFFIGKKTRSFACGERAIILYESFLEAGAMPADAPTP